MKMGLRTNVFPMPIFKNVLNVRLLRNSCANDLADQAVEISSLLILWILAAPVEDTHIDTRIHTLKGIAHLGGCQRPLATQYDNHRHLKASKSLVYIHGQVIAEERGHGKASIGLVRTGIDILYQFIGDQAWIMIALEKIKTAKRKTRHSKIVKKKTKYQR